MFLAQIQNTPQTYTHTHTHTHTHHFGTPINEYMKAYLEDAGAGRLGHAQGADRELGNLEHAHVVGHGANDNNHLAVVLAARCDLAAV